MPLPGSRPVPHAAPRFLELSDLGRHAAQTVKAPELPTITPEAWQGLEMGRLWLEAGYLMLLVVRNGLDQAITSYKHLHTHCSWLKIIMIVVTWLIDGYTQLVVDRRQRLL